jgi:hypothetical protein
MRQLRLAILAGIGILALCGAAIAVALSDYVSHPAVAVAHVPPVVGPGAPDPADTAAAQAPPLPQTPVTAVPVDQAPPAQAAQQRQAAAQPIAQQNQDALARLLQQLQQRRHHPPR